MKKILIVEDDKFLSTVYSMKLVKEGFETKIAADGEEAMQFLDSFSPDLIVLDLILPKKDGFSVLTDVKSSEKWRAIPIVVASNLGQREDTEKALHMGVDDYIVKSDLSMDDMMIKINTLLVKGQTT